MTSTRTRLLCLLLALVLAAAGLTVLIDVVAVAAGHAPLVWPQQSIAGRLRASRWGDIPILAVAAAFALAGLLLLWSSADRGRRGMVPLRTGDEHVDAATTRQSLRRAVADEVGRIDGIDRNRVRLRGRRVQVHASTPLRDPRDLPEVVRTVVAERLAAIRTEHEYKVTARVRARTGRS
ncbi:DUF6286 domain-containing protein [Peterkaempfera bronchialis]|uniref:DUF6286 domain-containing protein n=1 Tax=Peterkaempfera bronchialis TaxID=2126346 RepID=UPI003C2AC39F